MREEPVDELIEQRVRVVRERVRTAAQAAGRDPDRVQILLATKSQPPELIRSAVAAGVDLLGENRVQEITGKADALQDIPHRLHLIGTLQSNKINAVLPHVDCIETIDRADLAGRIDARLDRILDVMIQVNVSGEDTKSGVAPKDAAELIDHVRGLAQLRLTGLMTIGLNSTDESAVRQGYATLRELRDRHLPGGLLSMGMTRDLELAIDEGADIVRVGSAVFGSRS